MRYARQMRKLQEEEAEVAALMSLGQVFGVGRGEFQKPAPPVTKTPAETLEAFRRIGVPIVLEKAN